MVRIEKCSFCGCSVYPGHGSMYVRNDAKIFRFCSSKCDKNFKLKKNPRRTKWTKAFRRAAGKEMANDKTFAFERRNNVPVKTNSKLIQRTISAMKRVSQIQARRQATFYEKRMRIRGQNDARAAILELKRGLLLMTPEQKVIAQRNIDAYEAWKASRKETQDAEMLPVSRTETKIKKKTKAVAQAAAMAE
eukprot:NODE_4509_length_777_cov_82.318462_g4486_i0.p1 GENE.NODE_4509_length_777_cov_82.318462_g4486_i0~~NODE_4509_length_777_cov_82.318462_g4486_i0.p1  ORF type:complete len:191 (-),score=24.43 NODE_4509_length_777_cov_82.318462_g4486_i0:120-692(-)